MQKQQHWSRKQNNNLRKNIFTLPFRFPKLLLGTACLCWTFETVCKGDKTKWPSKLRRKASIDNVENTSVSMGDNLWNRKFVEVTLIEILDHLDHCFLCYRLLSHSFILAFYNFLQIYIYWTTESKHTCFFREKLVETTIS